MTMLPSHRLALAALVVSSAIGISPKPASSPAAPRLTPQVAAMPALAMLPPELVPAVVDAMQASGGPAFHLASLRTGVATATNDVHGFDAYFGDHDVAIATDRRAASRHDLSLSARVLDVDGDVHALRGARQEADGNRVAYAHAPVDSVRLAEWFRNGPLGFQHGFDVTALPAAARQLGIVIDLGTAWAAEAFDATATDGVVLRRRGGVDRLLYGHLRAWDGSGRFLPAAMSAVANGIRISVDVSGAVLPITIDPLLQQATLTPPSNPDGNGVGTAVAVHGNRALVGAPFVTVGGNSMQGVVYFFQRSPTTGLWALRATLTDPAGQVGDRFGFSVALDSDARGAIGAPFAARSGITHAGKVFHLFINDSGATDLDELDGPAGANEALGYSVAMDDGDIVAGALWEGPLGRGTAHVFGVFGGDGYGYLTTLEPPDPHPGDHFGFSVSISDGTVIVGAPNRDSLSPARPDVGAAYAFVRDVEGEWSFQARLDRPGTQYACDHFGGSVAVDGHRVLIGAGVTGFACDPGGNGGFVSEVHEFTRSAATWSLASSFTPSLCNGTEVCLGTRVALAGRVAIIGLPHEIFAGSRPGRVNIHRLVNGTWTPTEDFGPDVASRYGASVSINSGIAMVGMPGTTGLPGAAYAFVPTPGDLHPVIGDGTRGYDTSRGGLRTKVNFLFGMSAPSPSRLLIADTYNHRLREYLVDRDYIQNLAGTGVAGGAGDGGFASSAQLHFPNDVAVDGANRIYVSEFGTGRIRRIASGIITTIAGTGTPGYSGDGGPGTSAQLREPYGLTVDSAGNAYVADAANHRIRRIDATTGIITTFAGTGVAGYNGDGIAATAAQLNDPRDVKLAPDGSLYIADSNGHRVRRVNPSNGQITTVLGTGVTGFSGDGGPATSAQIGYVTQIDVDSAGNLYIADYVNHRVRRVTASTNLVHTIAGTGATGNAGEGGPALSAAVELPNALAVSPSGIFIESTDRVLKIEPPGPQLLTVNRTGGGTGTVTSAPAGISCGTTCNATFPHNTPVTLIAGPAGGSVFTGWSGEGCNGTGTCTVTMSQARTVAASFAMAGAAPTITTRTPSRGSTHGHTVVILTGQNFVAGTTVRVGATPVAVFLRGTTELSFVTPSVTAPGVQTITVDNGSGQATTTFEYAAPTYETHTGWRRPSFAVDRYTAFETSLPLLPEDTNGVTDVYVHDDVTDALRRVSLSSAGREALGGDSSHAAISASGRFVAFESVASNLVHSDSNGLTDVFLHDRDADENGVFDELGGIATTRASVSSLGAQATGGASTGSSISGTGRFVAFQSNATNLEAGDGNGAADVFVHDRLLGETRRVSIATDGASVAVGTSLRPVISQNGRFVAFDSSAVLTSGDSNGVRDVFVHDRDLDVDGVMDEPGAVATRRVSVASSGVQAVGGDSVDPSITGDGRYVVYASTASNLVAADSNAVSDIFLHDRDVDADGVFDEPGQIATRRANLGAGGTQFTVASGVPRISANGKLLVFLVAEATTGAFTSGGAVTAAVTPSDPGKSAPWSQPDPTNTQPEPPGKWAPGPAPDPGTDTDTEDPTTSPDGDQWGGTDVTNVPTVVIHEEPEETVESPEIATVSPGEGSTNGGTLVAIEGDDLAGTLYWNGAPVAPLTTGATRWTVLAPPRGGAPPTVSLYFQDGNRRSNTARFTYITQSVPRWTRHDPLLGSVAGSVVSNVPLVIAGSGFTATTTVRIGREPAHVTAWTATSLTVTVPPASVAGPVPIIITNPDGAEATSGSPFTYQNAAGALSVATLQPQNGSIAGGTAVTILGGGFTAATTVSFNGRPSPSVQFLSSRTLVVEAPPSPPGDVTVTVWTPGQAAVSVPFHYDAPEVTVTSCSGADIDGDGMADAWERQFGLSAGDPGDGADDPDGDGRSNLLECQAGTHPRGRYTRYLAEGATGSFFYSLVAIANPGATPARVLVRFQTGTGATPSRFLMLSPMSRASVHASTSAPQLASAEFSAVVESDTEVVVDRSMFWAQPGTGIYGSHAESSLAAPQRQWFLAEGATHGDFDLFYLLQNASTSDAVVRIRYLQPAGRPPVERDYVVPAQRRITISVDAVPGLEEAEVSAAIRTLNDVPIIVERAMYRTPNGTRVFESGHDSAAIAAPSTEWFFAEGATGNFFDTYLLLANPHDQTAQVTITYLLPNGATIERSSQLVGNSRATIYVGHAAPELASTTMSTIVRSTNGVSIVAERSMWWPNARATGGPRLPIFWGEGHNSPGATQTGTKWAVADGETGVEPVNTFTFYLVANTSNVAADVQITLLNAASQPLPARRYTVPANSRFTVSGADFPETRQDPNRSYGAVIESFSVNGQPPAQIVVERAMYSDAVGIFWAAGTNMLATRLR